MTLTPEHLEMLKDRPFLMTRWEPYDVLTDEEWLDHLSLARRQRVARYCLKPSWVQKARRHPDGEAAYWSKFSVGGIDLLPEASTPFSLEELKAMTYMEIVQKAQEIHNSQNQQEVWR